MVNLDQSNLYVVLSYIIRARTVFPADKHLKNNEDLNNVNLSIQKFEHAHLQRWPTQARVVQTTGTWWTGMDHRTSPGTCLFSTEALPPPPAPQTPVNILCRVRSKCCGTGSGLDCFSWVNGSDPVELMALKNSVVDLDPQRNI
jgi:hypothetical protein